MSPSQTLPPVSVFMTVRDEEAHLESAVRRILEQDYAGHLEVVVAVGPSADATEAIAARLADELGIVVVANPTGLTPHGLNAAIEAASHDILVRCDGHSLFPGDYVTRVVEQLEQTGAANVGGRMVPEGGASALSRAVALAMGSRVGLGGGAFHTGGVAGPQPTVYLGSFRRGPVTEVGGYDEYFLRAQDWELNHRLRRNGHVVWFDPALGVTYRPRSSWRDLLRQQWRTGAWRRRVMLRYPETAAARYLAPPVMVVATCLALVGAVIGVVVGPTWAVWALGLPALYALSVTIAAVVIGRDLDRAARVRLPGALMAIHWAWGTGFLVGRR